MGKAGTFVLSQGFGSLFCFEKSLMYLSCAHCVPEDDHELLWSSCLYPLNAGITSHSTKSCLFSAGDWTQGLAHAKQEFYLQSYLFIPIFCLRNSNVSAYRKQWFLVVVEEHCLHWRCLNTTSSRQTWLVRNVLRWCPEQQAPWDASHEHLSLWSPKMHEMSEVFVSVLLSGEHSSWVFKQDSQTDTQQRQEPASSMFVNQNLFLCLFLPQVLIEHYA